MSGSEAFVQTAPSGSTPTRRAALGGAAAFTAGAYFAGLGGALAQYGISTGAIDVGAGDVGVLNYAYALEQLEAAFYTQVTATPYYGMSAYEAQALALIRDHEITHRNFLAANLLLVKIPDLTPNFSRINFNSRTSVLTTARTFEDLGVSAYNGAGQLLTNGLYLSIAGSIVSVEARHAAIIRDIINPLSTSFAGDDIVNRAGLESPPRLPSQVLPKAAPFIATPVSARQLP